MKFMIDQKEYLAEYVSRVHIPGFMKNLADYYKYHNEIPRFFSKKLFELYFQYHDEKRKLNY